MMLIHLYAFKDNMMLAASLVVMPSVRVPESRCMSRDSRGMLHAG